MIVLILDEFPLDTLLRPDGSIDAERYPNFADLAKRSTWFPNAFTIYDSTFKAVPAIMDSVLPRKGTAADFHSHPRSVYHLFDGLGYEVVDVESGEALCPPRICPAARTTRPGVLKRLAGGGRPARLHAWIGAIRKRAAPTFYLQHALLPHEPWIYLPSGHQSRPKGNDPIPAINGPVGFHDQALTNHNETRHLLQVGYVDHQVGLLLARLRQTGLLDQAMIVVTADHGIAFEVGVKDRRLVTERNVEQIAPIPLFVKAPGQTTGEVDESFVRTIDIVPTMADLLDAEVPWRHDGHSAFAPVTQRRDAVALPTRDFSRVIRIGKDELARRRLANRRRRARLVETGAESQLLFGSPWAALYRVGSHPDLIGRQVSGLGTARAGTVRATAGQRGALAERAPRERGRPDPRDRQARGRSTERPARRGRGGGRDGVGHRPELPAARSPGRVLLDAGAGGFAASRAQPGRAVRGGCRRAADVAVSEPVGRPGPSRPAGSGARSGRAPPRRAACSRR